MDSKDRIWGMDQDYKLFARPKESCMDCLSFCFAKKGHTPFALIVGHLHKFYYILTIQSMVQALKIKLSNDA